MGAVSWEMHNLPKGIQNKRGNTVTNNNNNKSSVPTRPTLRAHWSLNIKIPSNNVFRKSHQKFLPCVTLYPRHAKETFRVFF